MTGLLNTAEQIAYLVGTELKGAEWVAVDTEFIRENTYFPQLEILQIATEEKSWLVDLATLTKLGQGSLEPLWGLLKDPNILKVMHAAQGDQECLAMIHGFTIAPVFDTAVGAALCGMGESVGLGSLISATLNIELQKGHSRTHWGVRPLPESLLKYAHEDVIHLIAATRVLKTRLEELSRWNWALEISEKSTELSQYRPTAREAAERFAKGGKLDALAFSCLIELISWRESRAERGNLPRRWICDDQVLIDIARVRPKDLSHLGQFRGLSKGEIKGSGEAILLAVKKGIESVSTRGYSPSKRFEIPNSRENQISEVVKCLVSVLSDEKRIATKYLLTTAQIVPLIRAQVEDPEQWVREGLISSGAYQLIGSELSRLLRGTLCMRVVPEKEQKRRVGVEFVDL